MNCKPVLAAGLGAVLGGLLAYARRVEPDRIEVTQQAPILPRLDPAFDGYRLVQISDIHLNGWMTRERLARIVAWVNQQRPDLVAITGDFLTNNVPYDPEDLIAPLSQLAPTDATVAVLGNHDHKHPTGPAPLREALRLSGIIALSNAAHTLRRGEGRLHIAGLDDVARRQARLDLLLAALPEEGAAILLAHEPDFADLSAPTGRFDLQLSGHSHGGQVRLPFMKPPVVPTYAQRYRSGRYRVDGMILYVNRGVGMVGAKLRLNCRPEIAVFTLRAGKERGSGSG